MSLEINLSILLYQTNQQYVVLVNRFRVTKITQGKNRSGRPEALSDK